MSLQLFIDVTVIFLFSLVLLGCKMQMNYSYNGYGLGANGGGGIVLGVALIISLASIYLILDACTSEPYTETNYEDISIKSSTEIVALKDKDSMEVFLGCGSSGSDYAYLTKNASGGYTYQNVDTSKAQIIETDDDNYRVEEWTIRKRGAAIYLDDIGYKIYVPKGSIDMSYKVDLQ